MRVARVVLATIVAIASAPASAREKRGLIARTAQGTRASSSIAPGTTSKRCSASTRCLRGIGRDLEILVKRGACYLKLNKPEKALADFDFVNRHTAWASLAFGPRGDLRPQLDVASAELSGPQLRGKLGQSRYRAADA